MGIFHLGYAMAISHQRHRGLQRRQHRAVFSCFSSRANGSKPWDIYFRNISLENGGLMGFDGIYSGLMELYSDLMDYE